MFNYHLLYMCINLLWSKFLFWSCYTSYKRMIFEALRCIEDPNGLNINAILSFINVSIISFFCIFRKNRSIIYNYKYDFLHFTHISAKVWCTWKFQKICDFRAQKTRADRRTREGELLTLLSVYTCIIVSVKLPMFGYLHIQDMKRWCSVPFESFLLPVWLFF